MRRVERRVCLAFSRNRSGELEESGRRDGREDWEGNRLGRAVYPTIKMLGYLD